MKITRGLIPIVVLLYGLLAVAGALGGCSSSPAVGISLTSRQTSELLVQHQNDSDFVILDVRTPAEYRQGHIAGAVLLDYYSPQFSQSLDRLDRSKTYLVYCRSGNRSGRTLQKLAALGFKHVYHLSGGVLDWNSRKYPLVKQ